VFISASWNFGTVKTCQPVRRYVPLLWSVRNTNWRSSECLERRWPDRGTKSRYLNWSCSQAFYKAKAEEKVKKKDSTFSVICLRPSAINFYRSVNYHPSMSNSISSFTFFSLSREMRNLWRSDWIKLLCLYLHLLTIKNLWFIYGPTCFDLCCHHQGFIHILLKKLLPYRGINYNLNKSEVIFDASEDVNVHAYLT
jgi:hypothetical protein